MFYATLLGAFVAVKRCSDRTAHLILLSESSIPHVAVTPWRKQPEIVRIADIAEIVHERIPAPADQPRGVDVPEWVGPCVKVGIQSPRETNRITGDKPTYRRIVVPMPHVPPAGLVVEILARQYSYRPPRRSHFEGGDL